VCEELRGLVNSDNLDVEYAYMNNGCGDDDTSAKLAHGDDESAVHADRCKPGCQNWRENTKSAGDQDDEEKADSQRYIVVVVGCSTAHVNRSSLGVNAVPDRC
jgi:hypothetical protein